MERCVTRVQRGVWSRMGQCSRNGTMLHTDGKPYCKQHYPPYVKERDDTKTAKYRAEWARQQEQRKYGWLGKKYEDLLVKCFKEMKGYSNVADVEMWDNQYLAERLRKEGLI